MKIVWVVFATFAAAAIYYTAIRAGFMEPPLGPISDIPFSIGMMYIFYFIGKIYCRYWKDITGYSRILDVYAKLVLPVMSILFPAIVVSYRFKATTLDVNQIAGLLLAIIVLLYLLADRRGAVERIISGERRFGLGGGASDNRYFFLQYPPRKRLDLLPQDILINGVWLGLLAYRVFTVIR